MILNNKLNTPVVSQGVIFNKMDSFEQYNEFKNKLNELSSSLPETEKMSIEEVDEFFYYPDELYEKTVDNEPTENSDSLITSGGVYSALKNIQEDYEKDIINHNNSEEAHPFLIEEINKKTKSFTFRTGVYSNDSYGFSNEDGIYYYDYRVSVAGLEFDDTPIVGLDSTNLSFSEIEKAQSNWSEVKKITTGYNSYTVYTSKKLTKVRSEEGGFDLLLPLRFHVIRGGYNG